MWVDGLVHKKKNFVDIAHVNGLKVLQKSLESHYCIQQILWGKCIRVGLILEILIYNLYHGPARI